MDDMESTLILIKPEGIQRGLVGAIIQRFEAKGLKLVATKMCRPDVKIISEHYREHEGADFYADLICRMMAGPLMAMVWSGPGSVAAGRKVLGGIREDYALTVQLNVCHASDSVEAARREIELWFQGQMAAMTTLYQRDLDRWIFRPITN